MEFLSFVTDGCLDAARHHGVEREVKKLANKVEDDQSISSWDKFLPSPYIKKSLGRDWRVIAERRPLANRDVIVICFLTLLSRGSHEYEKFIEEPENFGKPLLPA